MDTTSNDNYVLVLEDRADVKNKQEVGKLSVVSNINEKGKLKIAPTEEANQSDFLKFNSRDGLLKNFMENFLSKRRFIRHLEWALNYRKPFLNSAPAPHFSPNAHA